MQKRAIQILLFSLAGMMAVGQTKNSPVKLLSNATSHHGNYIYLYSVKELTEDSVALRQTDHFIIERTKFDSANLEKVGVGKKKIGEARCANSIEELIKYYSLSEIEDIKKLYSFSTNDELVNYFNTHTRPKDYPIIYSKIETKLALGQVFLDSDVKKGDIYFYIVIRVKKDKTQEAWGFSLVQSKAGNYTLPYYKPLLKSIKATDSLINLTWQLPVSMDLYMNLPKPTSLIAKDSGGLTLKMPFYPSSLKANVMIENNGSFIETQKLLPVLNASNDTVTYFYTKKCLPEEALTAYLITEDEVYNQGISSDTAHAYAIQNNMVPFITGIRINEIVNGIQISWDKVPEKPYLTGVQIGRYNSDEVYDSIATVPVSDTSFIDYQVQVGQHYRYKVKTVFLPGLGVEQSLPAESVGTFTRFTLPLPPYDVTVENNGKNILLKWEAIDDPAFFGYYVYRGTSSKQLDLVAGPVTERNFLDTAASLSGRSEYYYAISTQNLRQDTSIYSPVVSITPNRKINTSSPTTINFYFSDNSLRVYWDDVRQDDNAIESFVVQKKTKEQKTFSDFTTQPVINNFIEDSNIVAGVAYQYRVASVSFRGDTEEYGETYEYTLPDQEVDKINLFFLRNVTGGIHISWPEMETNRKAYTIYRREASDKKFSKLRTVGSSTFFYVDKTARLDKTYVYSITITEMDNREGRMGNSRSIRRNK